MLTWHLAEKALHWVHFLLAGGVSVVSANVEKAEHNAAVNRCLGKLLANPRIHCPPLQFANQVPTPNFADIAKEMAVLFAGALIGVMIRVAWEKANPKHEFGKLEDE